MKIDLFFVGMATGIVLGIGARVIQAVMNLTPNNAFAVAMVPLLAYYLYAIIKYKNNADVLKEHRNKIILTGIAWLIATYVFLLNTTIF
ncbi:MAG: hypothetical protein GXN99_00760 [Candidatus Nanohaloarchaeota archaeon]|nr:hypothetical protein [Candidatus Nanohaloarchaeota archaeon]